MDGQQTNQRKKQEKIFILDRLINKPVIISIPEGKNRDPKAMIVYRDDQDKEQIGSILGYEIESVKKKGKYVRHLIGREQEKFERNKTKAKEMFISFKKVFKENFPTSVPISSRINLYGNTIYFYFFAEERFDFSEFVREYRGRISMRFFLYQVGARDRVRFHENPHEWYDPSGLPLMYSIFRHPLEQVSNDAISIQGIRGRNIDRLKDRSGKLNHTLSFEQEYYEKELPQYPRKGQVFTYNGQKVICKAHNLVTKEISLRAEHEKSGEFTGAYIDITLEDYKQAQEKNIKKK